MKLFFQLFKSLFIAVLFCLLLEHFGAITFCRDFKMERFLDKHLFVHMTTKNIDKFEESFNRITEHLRKKQEQKLMPEVKVGNDDRKKTNLNHRETI